MQDEAKLGLKLAHESLLRKYITCRGGNVASHYRVLINSCGTRILVVLLQLSRVVWCVRLLEILVIVVQRTKPSCD